LGGIATQGIRVMAETGNPNPLRGEVLALIDDGHAGEVVSGGAIPQSPGTSSALLTVDESFPLVSVTSMVAPSPDWFVGVDGLSLCDQGQWLEEVTVEMVAYDAGTDSGSNFTSSNSATNPQAPIDNDTPFLVDGELVSLGAMTFTLQ